MNDWTCNDCYLLGRAVFSWVGDTDHLFFAKVCLIASERQRRAFQDEKEKGWRGNFFVFSRSDDLFCKKQLTNFSENEMQKWQLLFCTHMHHLHIHSYTQKMMPFPAPMRTLLPPVHPTASRDFRGDCPFFSVFIHLFHFLSHVLCLGFSKSSLSLSVQVCRWGGGDLSRSWPCQWAVGQGGLQWPLKQPMNMHSLLLSAVSRCRKQQSCGAG